MRIADTHRADTGRGVSRHDAGERVLSGRISRGVADRINAVIWYSDLRGYTKITDTAAPDEIIPLLNDYAAAVIGAVRVAAAKC